MKRAMQSAMRLGAKGIRINVAGSSGRSGDRPHGVVQAKAACRSTPCVRTWTSALPRPRRPTVSFGVKVWVFKGEVLEHDPMAMDKRLATESGPAGEGGGRERSGDRPDRGPRRDRRETAGA
jgi:small subunit ribosomal protein S3